jgi:YihY family inner membrane protein
MRQAKRIYQYIKGRYELLSLKKYTTLAGTLVFFLIMSIMPLSFWLTLVIGRLPIDVEKILSLSVFDSVKSVLVYVQEEATNATAGASIILVVTTLYSSSNLFYQMRKSGEIIYDYQHEKEGLRIRFGALILLIIVMAIVVVSLSLFAFGSFLFSKILPTALEKVADYLLLIAMAYLLAVLLNMYICPYKEKIRSFLFGATVTVAAWVLAILGFSIYLKISSMKKLYGALSVVIVFLLWLYVLMICFIVGVILNSEKILKKRKHSGERRKVELHKSKT